MQLHTSVAIRKKWSAGWKMLSRSNVPTKPAALPVLQLAGSQQSSEPPCWVSSTSIVNSSWPTISCWSLCSLASHPREMPPVLSSLPFAQQLSQELREFPLLFFLQSCFSSYQVILHANTFIGEVTSDAELLEMRQVTSCC